MDAPIQKHHGEAVDEIFSLNIDSLDVEELEQRLEMAVAMADGGCIVYHPCSCDQLASCGTFCS